MFEFDQDAVDALLSDDVVFRRLFNRHATLKSQVEEANLGTVPIDDVMLENLKKEKLMLKDKMAAIIREYRHDRH